MVFLFCSRMLAWWRWQALQWMLDLVCGSCWTDQSMRRSFWCFLWAILLLMLLCRTSRENLWKTSWFASEDDVMDIFWLFVGEYCNVLDGGHKSLNQRRMVWYNWKMALWCNRLTSYRLYLKRSCYSQRRTLWFTSGGHYGLPEDDLMMQTQFTCSVN